MKVLVTGATGYLGAVAAEALATRDHQVLGLARSERSASALRMRGIEPVMGDFGDPVEPGQRRSRGQTRRRSEHRQRRRGERGPSRLRPGR